MGSFGGESSLEWDAEDSSAYEERIFVSVRLRPLNEKELRKNDVSEWECINNTTIMVNNNLQEHSMFPTAYTFDRLFGPECTTRQVYEEAAKKVVLSVLSGINSSIFAYGQTSSGKTYTMSGITEYTIADIYDYIDKHPERKFLLKFSAMEIYNEVVKDLLVSDGNPLRLLDDPVRGTVVEKLTEVTLRDYKHLKQLLSICEAQRQIGETNLNAMSSRSHQILCLIIESEAREDFGAEKSSILTSSLNFVDLAGSERASQTLSAGTRLKEGCHINRSLLTLGTVIRKLGKGRNGHIPYRDSKLTRILQHSLGGNARTAIICTMSPAHSYIEQSRSTLVFASCAKQVRTNAQVNVMMSEKALVQHLRREIARLENELRISNSLAASCNSASALKEKELTIEKLENEIRELSHHHDLALSRVEDMPQLGGTHQESKYWVDFHNHEKSSWIYEYSASDASEITDLLHSDFSSRTSHFSDRIEGFSSSRFEYYFPENSEEQFLSDGTSPRLYMDKYFGPQSPEPGWIKIVQEAASKFEGGIEELYGIETDFTETNLVASAPLPLKGDYNSERSPCSSDEDICDPSIDASWNRSCAAILATITKPPTSEVPKEQEKTLQDEADDQGKFSNAEPDENSENLHTDSHSSIRSDFLNDKEEKIKTVGEDCEVKQEESYVAELSEVIKPMLVEQSEDDSDLEDGRASNSPEKTADDGSNKDQYMMQSVSDWPAEFERQKKEIIELWDACNIPLVYRTYFFLLFKGDPADAVYMEVELRRLSLLQKKLHATRVVKDDQFFTVVSSKKALNQERMMLSKQMLRKFSGKERKDLYKKWGIDLKTKHRRFQLCCLLWTDTTNMDHIKESAAIVARLVGFQGPGQAPKEMIGLLSFSSKHKTLRSFGWRHTACLPSYKAYWRH